MHEESTSSDQKSTPFPFRTILALVLGSMTATSFLFWGWHVWDIARLEALHEEKNMLLEMEIQDLSIIREQIGEGQHQGIEQP